MSLKWAENKEKHSIYKKELYKKRKDYYLDKSKKYYHSHKEEKAKYDKKYKPTYRNRRNQAHRDRYKTDPEYKLCHNIRARIWDLLRRRKNPKSEASIALLGCSIEFLKAYLESKFQPGMSWDNYGKYGWHIDHIKPGKSFDLSDPIQQKQCFHYSNLQPLWAKDNLTKGSKTDNPQFFSKYQNYSQ